jgi:hypothetical protein
LLPLVGDETAAHSPIKGFKKEDPRRLKSEAGWLKCEGCGSVFEEGQKMSSGS